MTEHLGFMPNHQSRVVMSPDVYAWFVGPVGIERLRRRDARRLNLRSLRNMTHWRRRARAWKYLR